MNQLLIVNSIHLFIQSDCSTISMNLYISEYIPTIHIDNGL